MRPSVLIVEDDPIQADVFARLLGARGYFPDVVDNGRDAVRRLRAGLFDVALVDYRIPEIDGLAVALVIRNLEGLPRRPRLIAVTASPDELLDDAGEFDAILAKPIDIDSLLQAVEGVHPNHAEPPVQPTRAPERKAAATRPRILVADDDPHLRTFLKITFEASQMDVDVAEDGLQAIGLIENGSYDVVVVDFRMPKLDGLAAAKIIYDLLGLQDRPRIVALTSSPESLVAQDPMWSMVLDAIVSKASGPQAILSTVKNCLDYKAERLKQPPLAVNLHTLAEMELALAGSD